MGREAVVLYVCLVVGRNLIWIRIHIHSENRTKNREGKTQIAKTLPYALCERFSVCSIALALPHSRREQKASKKTLHFCDAIRVSTNSGSLSSSFGSTYSRMEIFVLSLHIKYACITGYILRSNQTVTFCTSTSHIAVKCTWAAQIPFCFRLSKSKYIFNCNVQIQRRCSTYIYTSQLTFTVAILHTPLRN